MFLGTGTQRGVCLFSSHPDGRGFPGGSEDNESAFNAGEPSLIPGSGRSSGEGNSNLLHYSLEKGMAIHSSILTWRIVWTEGPGKLQSMGLQRVGHD